MASAKPNSPNNEIMRLLPMADKIEAYIIDPNNLEVITRLVTDDIKNTAITRYKEEYKNMMMNEKRKQDCNSDLLDNKKLEMNSNQKAEKEINAEFIQACESQAAYIAYRTNQEKDKSDRMLKSTLKSKMALIIPFSEKTPVHLLKKFANNCLYKRAHDNPKAAELFFSHNIAEENFNVYLSLKPHSSREFIPNVELKGADSDDYKDFVLSKLDSADPEAAILGKFTGCCQWLGGAGTECVIYGITDPRGGFYVLRHQKSNLIIAQCWAWQNKEGNIVFDSIEIALNSREKHRQLIIDFYIRLAEHLTNKENIPCVLVGLGGMTPDELATIAPVIESFPVAFDKYRDSHNQTILSHKQLPFLNMLVKTRFQKSTTLKMLEETNLKHGGPCHIDKTASIIWNDIAFANKVDWNVLGNLVTFELSHDEMRARAQLSKQWISNIRDIHKLDVWEELEKIVPHVNILFRDAEGKSALFYAISENNTQVAMLLLIKLSEISNDNVKVDIAPKVTALSLACNKGNIIVAEYLHEHGAKIDDSVLFQPLTLPMLRFLHEKVGLDITKKNYMNNTIFSFANEESLRDLVSYTKQIGVFEKLILKTFQKLLKACVFLDDDERMTILKAIPTDHLKYLIYYIADVKLLLKLWQPETDHATLIRNIGRERLNMVFFRVRHLSLLEGLDAEIQCLLLDLIDIKFVKKLYDGGMPSVVPKEVKRKLLTLVGIDYINTKFINEGFNSLNMHLKELDDEELQLYLLSIIEIKILQRCYAYPTAISMLQAPGIVKEKLLELLGPDHLAHMLSVKDFDPFFEFDEKLQIKFFEVIGSKALLIMHQAQTDDFLSFLQKLSPATQKYISQILGSNLPNVALTPMSARTVLSSNQMFFDAKPLAQNETQDQDQNQTKDTDINHNLSIKI